MPPDPNALERLPHLPASDVKKRGWRGVMREVRDHRAVVVTNHEEPEAVILPAAEYARLLERLEPDAPDASALAALRRRFDERLAALRAPDAGTRLRSIVRGETRLRGKVKAGDRY